MPLAEVVEKLTERLDKKDNAREDVIDGSRQIIRLTRQAVSLLHQKRERAAMERINDALKLLDGLSHVLREYPELYYGGILTPAQQEVAEASILASLLQGKSFPELDGDVISPAAYLLGLADAVGELRRECLDDLRRLKLDKAEHSFALMEEIYESLAELDYSSGLVPGLRHKTDTARRLVEETRTDVTRARLLLSPKRK